MSKFKKLLFYKGIDTEMLHMTNSHILCDVCLDSISQIRDLV